MIQSVNEAVFLALNAPVDPPSWLVQCARLMAAAPIWITVAIVAALWIWGAPEKRGSLVATGLGLLVSLTIAMTIASLWYHPRPAELGLGHAVVFHEPETSFPSDHATFLWAIGFGLIAARLWRGWGLVVSVLGLAAAWARVYLGIHFPLDMAGAFVIAVVGAAVAATAQPWLTTVVLPLIERPYEALLRLSHLPSGLFPRQEGMSAAHQPGPSFSRGGR